MPNIIFGIGALLIALFVIQRFIPAFGTLWLLLIAFIVGRISYATRMTNTGLIQIHRSWRNRARSAALPPAASS